MKTYLVFTNENDANAAQAKIWCNFLLTEANNSEKLVGNGVGQDYYLSDIEPMPDNELCLLKLYGKKEGLIQDLDGFTITWAQTHQCYNDSNKWVFMKPDNSLMTGVVNYTEAPRDPNWWPPEEE